MNIVAILPLYLPWRRAGAEVMTHALLRGLADAGHSVRVLVIPEVRRDSVLPLEEVCLDGVQIKVCTIAQLRALLDGSRSIDVVISQLGASTTASELARSHQAKYIEVVHADDPRTYRNLIACRPDLTIFNTRLQRDFFMTHCGRSEVLHPPVNPDIHRTHKGSHVTLVNLRQDKGVGLFRSMAEQLPEIPFLGVVGGYGVQETDDFPENVTIQNHTPDMRSDVWSRTRVLMMPSKSESYGMVALEAAASGIPVVANMLAASGRQWGHRRSTCTRKTLKRGGVRSVSWQLILSTRTRRAGGRLPDRNTFTTNISPSRPRRFTRSSLSPESGQIVHVAPLWWAVSPAAGPEFGIDAS